MGLDQSWSHFVLSGDLMPSIDYTGPFFVHAVCTDKDSRGALHFPVKASSLDAARRFADRVVLDLLPGWGKGLVSIRKGDKWVNHHKLVRK